MDELGGDLVEDCGFGQAVRDLTKKWRGLASNTVRTLRLSEANDDPGEGTAEGEDEDEHEHEDEHEDEDDVVATAGIYARLEAFIAEYVAAMHYCAAELALAWPGASVESGIEQPDPDDPATVATRSSVATHVMWSLLKCEKDEDRLDGCMALLRAEDEAQGRFVCEALCMALIQLKLEHRLDIVLATSRGRLMLQRDLDRAYMPAPPMQAYSGLDGRPVLVVACGDAGTTGDVMPPTMLYCDLRLRQYSEPTPSLSKIKLEQDLGPVCGYHQSTERIGPKLEVRAAPRPIVIVAQQGIATLLAATAPLSEQQQQASASYQTPRHFKLQGPCHVGTSGAWLNLTFQLWTLLGRPSGVDRGSSSLSSSSSSSASSSSSSSSASSASSASSSSAVVHDDGFTRILREFGITDPELRKAISDKAQTFFQGADGGGCDTGARQDRAPSPPPRPSPQRNNGKERASAADTQRE